jgi:hypothetical protein
MRILKFMWFSSTSKDTSGHSTNLTLSQTTSFHMIIQVHPPVDPVRVTASIN